VARLNALSVELNEIRSVNEVTLQRNAELLAQIAACESRREHVHGALAESERIAREITLNAEHRVDRIMANAQRVLAPQQEQLARLEKEIGELTEEIYLRDMATPEFTPAFIPEFTPDLTEMAFSNREFSMREPQHIAFSNDQVPMGQIADVTPEPQPEVRREFSLRKPQEPEPDIADEIVEVRQPEQNQYNPQPEVRREFSLREPQEVDMPLDNGELQQPQIPEQPEQSAQPGYSLPESQVEEITNYNLAMSLMEQNESNMNLDVFVDTRYLVTTGEKTGQMQKHSWQVKIDVEVPTDTREFVGYGKVSSAVTSTLLRYDDIVLNDVYPFGIITPNTENIAMYFYNCLQDAVTLMDLRLKEVSIWENQVLIMQVNRRNNSFDDQLQKGDDILQDIRGLLAARDRGEDKPDAVIKGRLGHIFKK